ncbi:conserved hypothetical protein [Prochlorococcus marinus str. MIT 9312]|uniref:TIGR03792 family protein n=1 Tax=Prochlorococcus marinus (strain MIT 9312) TaxID=74546 RepID=Q319L2_PROM9|nr:TIGR03792 family protein [Prochlorococcus marinus]ABB50433.1 conserved hypothetical protein [Prochlorococcus marinus str. MIT 9312]KGF99768.1 hypothetical protein EU97_1134 [Prochlorococcus marinus str. MIT 9311]
MKINSNFKKRIKSFFFLFFSLFVFLNQINTHITEAIAMDNYKQELVVEELRLKVPAQYKEVWLKTEKKIWEPWLSSQDGFLGRQLFWDKEKEEALILVNWKSKKLWKSIPMSEVNVVQEKFEDNVKTDLNVSENPFELIYEGELNKQV